MSRSTPHTRRLLRILASRPPDMHDEELQKLINDEMRKCSIDELTTIRDRVRFSCPPDPFVQSVVLMLNGLIDLKMLGL